MQTADARSDKHSLTVRLNDCRIIVSAAVWYCSILSPGVFVMNILCRLAIQSTLPPFFFHFPPLTCLSWPASLSPHTWPRAFCLSWPASLSLTWTPRVDAALVCAGEGIWPSVRPAAITRAVYKHLRYLYFKLFHLLPVSCFPPPGRV